MNKLLGTLGLVALLLRPPAPDSDWPTAGGGPTWGYLAVENGILYGSLVNPEHIVKWRYRAGDMSEQFTESTRFFALDAVTGKRTYDAKASIRHNAIAVGAGRVHLIDRPLAEGDKLTAPKGPGPEQAPGGNW